MLTFRYIPSYDELHVSKIGVVLLDENTLKPIGEPELLNTRITGTSPSQSEDARVFAAGNQLYLIYTDNMEITNPLHNQKRDMHICKLHYVDGHFLADIPLEAIP